MNKWKVNKTFIKDYCIKSNINKSKMIFPKELKKGDKIGVIAPASPCKKYSLEKIEECIKNYGYKAEFGKSCYGSYKGYLSSTDETRAKDIESMFLNKDIDAIFCIRGGYGTPRILDMIDYSIIKENPKIFVGFSDITTLLNIINQKCNLITFHGPMLGSISEWDNFTSNSLLENLNSNKNLEVSNPNNEKIKTLITGKCEGQLVGGNLSLITATMGTEYEIDTKGKIIFIEEIEEKIYNIDRMLTQLALGNKFKDCAGIIFGDFCNCTKSDKEDFDLEELIIDRVKKYNKPCIYNLKSGHCSPMITLAIGANYKLDITDKDVKLNMYK